VIVCNQGKVIVFCHNASSNIHFRFQFLPNLEKRQLDFEWIPGLESLKQKAVKGKKNKSLKKGK